METQATTTLYAYVGYVSNMVCLLMGTIHLAVGYSCCVVTF